MSSQVIDFIDKNRNSHLETFKSLLRIPSISAQPDKKPELLRCAEVEAELFKKVGLENVRLIETTGHPMVYGDWLHAAGKPTILIYGHYDVQPPDPLEEWKTAPFEPTIQGDNIYGRGTCDNKGQHLTHLLAIEAFLKTEKKLPVNVKVILEGDEEVGSGGIMDYLPKHGGEFSCDAVLISDTSWADYENPTLVYTLRGLNYFEILVEGPSFDLHSGVYGGMVRNPAQALSWILAKLKSDEEKILIPNLYDDVKTVPPSEREEMRAIPFDEAGYKKETGVASFVSEKGFTPPETNWTRPALDICGIWGGYQGLGAKTIIPARAGAKVSIRIVANQDPKKVARQFENYVHSIAPSGVKVTVKCHQGGPALYVDRENIFLKKVAKGYEKGFGKKVNFRREGASIPVAAVFQDVLKVPVILMGLGLPDDRLHSPNEKFSLNNFYGGIRSAVYAYEELGGAGGI